MLHIHISVYVFDACNFAHGSASKSTRRGCGARSSSRLLRRAAVMETVKKTRLEVVERGLPACPCVAMVDARERASNTQISESADNAIILIKIILSTNSLASCSRDISRSNTIIVKGSSRVAAYG